MEAQYTQKQLEIANRLVAVMDSKFFKSMGEPVRVQIIRFLLLNGRADIGAIAENMPQDRSVISRHLNLMQEVGILNCEKEGRHMFYSLNAAVFLERFTNITDLVKTCIEECGPLCCKPR
ncbi:MAG: helix-turn-helix transcriptional regulator [Desulfobacterales bacterium]|nr:helix-turn-helix transcriptional regulator [Desulfobacterales bacterium]